MAKARTTQEILGDALTMKRVIAELNKQYGPNTMGTPSDIKTLEISRIPTGVAKLDKDLGGGLPKGRMVELYGIPSSGKSLISLLTIKQAQAMGLDCVYFDVENSYDPTWAKALGVDTDKLIIVNLEVAEDIFNAMVEVLKANPGVIVVDSIASMVTKAELEEPLEQVFMAPKARFLSKALGKINAHNKETLIIFINQLRDNLTAMGAFGTKTPGGRALTHGMSIRLKIHRDSALLYKDGKKSGEVIGQVVQYNIEKNKTSAPNKVGSFKYLYDGPTIEE